MTLAGASQLHEAINEAWDASTLDADFEALWAAGESDDFEVLNDGEAAPEQPFPYCVFEQTAGTVEARMSADATTKRQIRDIPWRFAVYAKKVSGDGRTAKKIAADLAEKVMKVFGGHPTTSPDPLTLDDANHLITQYVSDFGVRLDDEVHSWTIDYLFRLDVLVKS